MQKQESLLPDTPTSALDLLQLLAVHQFLTALQLAALQEAPVDEVTPMLDDLLSRKLVTILRAPGTVDEPGTTAAFALTRRGAAVLGSATGEVVRAPDRRKSLFMLDHDLARNDLVVVLTQLHRRGAVELLRWETARTKLADSVWLRVRGKNVRVPLVPDALAVIRVGSKVNALVVEIDRGTVSAARMALKYGGFNAWWRSGGPLRRFGVSAVRVLTIVPTPSRASRLRQSAMSAVEGAAGALFWFGVQASVDVAEPLRLLTARWSTAAPEGTPLRLFENARDQVPT